MRTQLPSILTALSVVSYARTAFGACYFDTGDLVTEPDYLKCVDTPTCCALNRTSSRSKDECLPNGLCENTALSNNNVETVTYWRDWCSNEDWSNGKCLSICIPTDTNQRFKTQQVTPCTGKSDSSKWCCGDTTACCTDDDKSGAVVLAATFGQSISSSTSSPTSTPTTASSSHPASTTAASSTSPSSTPPPASKSSDGLPTGAKVGIAVGAVGAAALIFVAGFIIAKKKPFQRSAKYHHPGPAPVQLAAGGSSRDGGSDAGRWIIGGELDDNVKRSEVYGMRMAHELPEKGAARGVVELP